VSQPHADRNLLFGILALQMDFIRRDDLIAAMNAWVLDKDKPLGRVLVGQQALGEDEHALLEALVQKHLQRHGDDPRKSLAAVSSLTAARQDLEQLANPDVQASSVSGQRFRILRPHARGGLGEVFVAEDQELHREVALNPHPVPGSGIRAPMADPARCRGPRDQGGI
jgi:hypothetical protein